MKLQMKDRYMGGYKEQRHPYVYCKHGMYVVYVDGEDGVYCHSSIVLLGDYSCQKCVFRHKDYFNFHSPCAVYIKDRIYLYVSCYKKGEEKPVILVACSNKPTKDFIFLKELCEGDNPSIHITSEGLYLFFNLCIKENDNPSLYIQKMLNPILLDNYPICIFKAKDIVITHPYYFYKFGYHYLFYTCYKDGRTSIHYKIVKDRENELLKINFFSKNNKIKDQVLLFDNELEKSCGRASIAVRSGGDFFVYYEAKDIEEKIYTIHIARLFICLDKITTYIGKKHPYDIQDWLEMCEE